ncbi:MAG: hypothetical protein M1814_000189 [Vezdaea aestivalis]|nr:MAG: hypothetical protein M1814_000189 [Vezdaea aestivalis]
MPHGDVTVDIPLTPVGSHGHQMAARRLDSAASGDYLKESAHLEKQMTKESKWRRPHIGRRRVRKSEDKRRAPKEDEEGETLNKMGEIYSRILNFSLVTRYFLYVLPLAIIFAIPIIVGATAALNARIDGKDGVRIVWFFAWVEIVWLSLWVSKIFAQCLPWLFQFLCGIVSSGTRKYALVLKSLETPLSLAGWALASLCTFKPIMTRNPDNIKKPTPKPWQNTVEKILWALLVSSLIFLAQKLLVQLISINYHRKQFNSRIKTSKHNIYLLGLLYDASRTLFPDYCAEFAEEDYIINDSITLGSSKKASHDRSGSATPMRMLQNVGRVGDKLTSAFGNIAQELTGKEVFNPTSSHSVVVEALEKTKSSEALAKRLWMSFVVEGKESLYSEDILEVLGNERAAESEECFAALDQDGNGDVSLDEMIMTVVQFGRERHAVATSMADVDQAIHVLDKLLGVIIFVLIIFVFVGFLNQSFTTTLATAGTALLSLSFVFAATAQEVLGSCIFLFVKHAYDVGDRLDIKDDMLIVEHISLLYTVFRRVDTNKTVQIPNIVLNTVWIENISRSKAMRERVAIFIHFDTSLEDIHALRSEIQAFVNEKDNSRDFLPEVEVEVVGIAEMNKLELRVEIRHKSNWANETLRAARRSKFMCALVLALRKVPIYAPGGGDAVLGDIGKPSYSVAVSDDEAKAYRKKYLDDKEGKRLFPSALNPSPNDKHDSAFSKDLRREEEAFGSATSGADWYGANDKASGLKARNTPVAETRPSTAGRSERTAVEALNARNPASDSTRDDWSTYRDDMSAQQFEARRSSDLEDVRGLLHRQSTKGRRKAAPAPQPPNPSSVSPIASPITPGNAFSGPIPTEEHPALRMPPQSSATYAAPPPPPAKEPRRPSVGVGPARSMDVTAPLPPPSRDQSRRPVPLPTDRERVQLQPHTYQQQAHPGSPVPLSGNQNWRPQ